MREVFKGFSDAWAFAVGKEGAAVRVCNGGWEVTWTGEKAAPEPLENFPGEAKMLRDFALAEKKPAEIVQRHTVAGISETVAAQYKDEAYTVSLRAKDGPYNTGEYRHFGMSKEQAQLFKVGSEIEVVLRPAPLA